MSSITFDQHYIQDKKEMQQLLLNYIDGEENLEEYYQNLYTYIKEKQFSNSKSELKIFLNLLTKIANFHYRSTDFFNKIEKIIFIFKEDILKYLTNSEIFNLFQSNKRILLFLFESNILILDYYIFLKIYEDDDYLCYFYPEISAYSIKNKLEKLKLISSKMKPLFELINSNLDDFKNKRKIGENDTYICQIIRNDDIDHFISYLNKNNISLVDHIPNSIHETNHFIYQAYEKYKYGKIISLIEYASYFGSIQIFKYLYMNNAHISDDIWYYAIHGRHPEIIHMIEKHNFDNPKLDYDKYLFKSMKYYHNEIANYIMQNYYKDTCEDESKIELLNSYYAIEYYNFEFVNVKNKIQDYFIYFCMYGFTSLVNFLIEDTNVIQKATLQLENSKTRYSLLYNIINNEHFEIMKMLLEKHLIDINAVFYYLHKSILLHKYNLLFFAAVKNNYKMVKFLASQPNVNINFKYFQEIASYHGLYYEEEDIDEDPSSFIKESDESIDKINIEEFLLSFRDKNDYSKYIPIKKTVLQLAVEYKNREIVSVLLNHPNINVNCEMNSKKKYWLHSINGWVAMYREKFIQSIETPLLAAIENEDVSMVQLLLSHPKIDVNLKSYGDYSYRYVFLDKRDKKEKYYFTNFIHERKTPLCAAIILKNIEIIKMLLSNDNIVINDQSIIINDFQHFLISLDLLEWENDPKIILENISEIKEVTTFPIDLATKQQNKDILDLLISNKKKI